MKKPCLIIFLLTLATLSKGYCNCISSKTDTGKRFSAVKGTNKSIDLKIERSDIVKADTDLLRQQSSLLYSRLTDIRSNSKLAYAKLIRTGWDDGILILLPVFTGTI
jgi:hypothetical protein